MDSLFGQELPMNSRRTPAVPAKNKRGTNDPYKPLSGAELKWILQRAGVRQKEFAAACGVSARAVSKWYQRATVDTLYVAKLQVIVHGAKFFKALRDEYAAEMKAYSDAQSGYMRMEDV